MQTKTIRLLVELDALFDTRIGTIARLDLDRATALLHDPSYSSRLWDMFPGVDDVAFKDLYEKRNAKTLLYSQTTPVVKVGIAYFVQRCAETSYSQPVALVPEIHINFHPYNLRPEEEDLIISKLQQVIPLKPEIKKINMSYEQLNPLYVRSNYSAMWLYHGHKWLETHSKNNLLKEYPCQSVTLWCPALLDYKPEGVTLPENIQDYFYSMSIFSQFLINHSYAGIDNFCSYLSRKPKVVNQQPEPEEQVTDKDTEEFVTSLPRHHPEQEVAGTPKEQSPFGR